MSNYVKLAIHSIEWSQMHAANAQVTYEYMPSELGDSSGNIKICHVNVEASQISSNPIASSTARSGKHEEYKSFF